MIYLDSNATTQLHPEVLEAMMPYFKEHWHNPSSGYRAAKVVRRAIDTAREQVAALIGATPEEIIFTGCGTESNNSILTFLAYHALQNSKKKKCVTSAIEHSSVLRPLDFLSEKYGFFIEKTAVDSEGRLNLDAFRFALAAEDTALASIMWANNETGVVQPIKEACAMAKEAGVPFHTDAIQAVGKIPINVREIEVDYLSLSGHKIHAPKGVGALYVRKGLDFQPLLRGGGQERGRRSGTENVASIVGLGKAAEIMKRCLDTDQHVGVAQMRNVFEQRILTELEGVSVNGSQKYRTVNTSHLSFKNCEAAGLLILLDEYGVQCSAGSACMTGKQKPSHVQTAMGIPAEQAKSSLRISFSIFTTEEEVNEAVKAIKKAVLKLRSVQSRSGVGPVQIYNP